MPPRRSSSIRTVAGFTRSSRTMQCCAVIQRLVCQRSSATRSMPPALLIAVARIRRKWRGVGQAGLVHHVAQSATDVVLRQRAAPRPQKSSASGSITSRFRTDRDVFGGSCRCVGSPFRPMIVLALFKVGAVQRSSRATRSVAGRRPVEARVCQRTHYLLPHARLRRSPETTEAQTKTASHHGSQSADPEAPRGGDPDRLQRVTTKWRGWPLAMRAATLSICLYVGLTGFEPATP